MVGRHHGARRGTGLDCRGDTTKLVNPGLAATCSGDLAPLRFTALECGAFGAVVWPAASNPVSSLSMAAVSICSAWVGQAISGPATDSCIVWVSVYGCWADASPEVSLACPGTAGATRLSPLWLDGRHPGRAS